jgi:hypothetical protein
VIDGFNRKMEVQMECDRRYILVLSMIICAHHHIYPSEERIFWYDYLDTLIAYLTW